MDKEGKIILLTTGGTIAGTGEAGKDVGYTPGVLSADRLLEQVPALTKAPLENYEIRTEEICHINSDDITLGIWLQLAKRIRELSREEDVKAFVITHGTDTMEETAFFLDLVLDIKQPVVLTGAMHPSTSLTPDGPENLLHAFLTAADPQAAHRGVLVVFAGKIISGCHVRKVHTLRTDAITGEEAGILGYIRNLRPVFDVDHQEKELKKLFSGESFFNTLCEKFSKGLCPRVAINYFHADADPEILQYMIQNYDGVVIAGAGAGEYSKEYLHVMDRADIPVVITSRTGSGPVPAEALLHPGTISGGDLSPQKAAILLRLSLIKKEIRK